MALDGIFLHGLCEELKVAENCHIEKIYQPSRDELVFSLRSVSFKGSMIISTKTGAARLHFTESTPENPADPPNFCKLLRKHIGGGVITAISQDELDRTVFIDVSSYNEMRDKVSLRLVVELFTGKANVILCNEEGKILDALHRSDIESSPRLIQPGARFKPIEKQNKLNPFTKNTEELLSGILGSNKRLSDSFTQVIQGVSPLVSRELAQKVCENTDTLPQDLTSTQVQELKSALSDLTKMLSPVLLLDPNGEAKDFSYMPITQYGRDYKSEERESFSSLLDEFYTKKENAARIKGASQDILKFLNNLRARIQRKTAYRLSDLEKCKNREELRIYGELIKANLFAIEKGSSFAVVQNYYDEDLKEIKIPLNPSLSPSANAAKYFKDYKKTYVAEQTLTKLIEEDKKDLDYIDSVLDTLSRATTMSELEEIRQELVDSGYIRRDVKTKPKNYKPTPKKYVSKSGFEIYVGRNNKENDFLTLRLADKTDIWLHTKNIPGSHTIIITNGKEVDEETLIFAARLAAANSKGADSENVPVDYTFIKYVKKPNGAKAGMVIYTNNKTLFVTPLKENL
ncbi:MAG: NFACT family protein [Clostridia bacterium]|nr:NFACT family protein [Clostridia bacterium]